MNQMKRISHVSTLVFIFVAVVPANSRTIYVDNDASGTADGNSWTNAYRRLQDALVDANVGDGPLSVLVAQGVYKPDQGGGQILGDRNATFQLISCVTLRGGYAGVGEPDPNARDTQRYASILSGDLSGDDLQVDDPCEIPGNPARADNSYHVVTASGCDSSAVIDGFTITGGYAEPNVPYESMPYEPVGGGIYSVHSSLVVADCTFTANLAGDGGAMYNKGGHPRLTHCTFNGNIALQKRRLLADRLEGWYGHGGGIDSEHGATTLEDCVFSHNLAAEGGGIYTAGRGPSGSRTGDGDGTLTNCTFVDNRATGNGGGMGNNGSRPRLSGCAFSGNTAEVGGAIYNEYGYLALTACDFIGNSARHAGGGVADVFGSILLAGCKLAANRATGYGGGMHNSGSTSTISECLFSGNAVSRYFGRDIVGDIGGAGIYSANTSRIVLTNCTLAGNAGPGGNALHCFSQFGWHPSSLRLTNCILWNGGEEIANQDGSSVAVVYSNVQGGWLGEGNTVADPCFADAGHWDPNGTSDDPNDDFWVDGDYHLRSQAGRWDPATETWVIDDVTSPCIDAGDPNSPVGHEPFPNGGRINMGAYGGTTEASKSYFGEPACETIIAGDVNGDCRVDFADFEIMSRHWLRDETQREPGP
jgi:hypothetical protein